jgi:hypothetical protein
VQMLWKWSRDVTSLEDMREIPSPLPEGPCQGSQAEGISCVKVTMDGVKHERGCTVVVNEIVVSTLTVRSDDGVQRKRTSEHNGIVKG